MLGILAKSPWTWPCTPQAPPPKPRVSSWFEFEFTPTGKTSFESVRVRVHLNTSSAGLTELELGLGFELSARIELELELFFQLRPWLMGHITTIMVLRMCVGLTPPNDWFSDQTIHLRFLFVVKKYLYIRNSGHSQGDVTAHRDEKPSRGSSAGGGAPFRRRRRPGNARRAEIATVTRCGAPRRFRQARLRRAACALQGAVGLPNMPRSNSRSKSAKNASKVVESVPGEARGASKR